MKRHLLIYSIYLLCGLFLTINVLAQEPNLRDYRMRFRFKTVKLHDNSRILEAHFIAANKKDRKDRVPIYDASIAFYNVFEDGEVLLGTANTSKEGFAQITLPESHRYRVDSDGKINLKAVFSGTDGLDGKEREISIRDLYLDLDLVQVDSINTVLVSAYTLDSLGAESPLAEETDIIIAIEGMLSKMVLDEGTIEEGKYEFEMPTDLPGDMDGNITVYSTIEDHDEFGDVIQKKTEKWGVVDNHVKEETNHLWSEAAPIWMYVVLSIFLVGIWANFLYTAINLFLIKKEGKQLELETEK